MDLLYQEVLNAVVVLWSVLIDYSNYDKMDSLNLFFLLGCLFTIVIGMRIYFKVLNEYPAHEEQQWNG